MNKFDLKEFDKNNKISGKNLELFENGIKNNISYIKNKITPYAKTVTLIKQVNPIIIGLEILSEDKERLTSIFLNKAAFKNASSHPVNKFRDMSDDEIKRLLLEKEEQYHDFLNTYENLSEDEKKSTQYYYRKRRRYRRYHERYWLYDYYYTDFFHSNTSKYEYRRALEDNHTQYIKTTTPTESYSRSCYSSGRRSSSSSSSSSRSSYSGGSRGGSSSGRGRSGKC